LAPIAEAQNSIQNTAKHAQYMAEVLGYYYRDNNLSQEEAKIICSELRTRAVKITRAESLYELKIVYEAITNFVDITALPSFSIKSENIQSVESYAKTY
jgi:hypothetical protein